MKYLFQIYIIYMVAFFQSALVNAQQNSQSQLTFDSSFTNDTAFKNAVNEYLVKHPSERLVKLWEQRSSRMNEPFVSTTNTYRSGIPWTREPYQDYGDVIQENVDVNFHFPRDQIIKRSDLDATGVYSLDGGREAALFYSLPRKIVYSGEYIVDRPISQTKKDPRDTITPHGRGQIFVANIRDGYFILQQGLWEDGFFVSGDKVIVAPNWSVRATGLEIGEEYGIYRDSIVNKLDSLTVSGDPTAYVLEPFFERIKLSKLEKGDYSSVENCGEIANFAGIKPKFDLPTRVFPDSGGVYVMGTLRTFDEEAFYIHVPSGFVTVGVNANAIWLRKRALEMNQAVTVVGNYYKNAELNFSGGTVQNRPVLTAFCIQPGSTDEILNLFQ